MALFIRCAKLGALVGPRPHSAALTELLGITVCVTVAEVSRNEAFANTVLTVHTVALPGVGARATVVEINFEIGDVPAVSLGTFMVQL